MSSKGKGYLFKGLVAMIAAFIVPAFVGPAAADHCTEIRMNGSNIWFPVSVRDQGDPQLHGVMPDLAVKIFDEMHIPVTFMPEQPWTRQLALLDSGKLDVIAGAHANSDREKKYLVSVPVIRQEVGVYVRSDLKERPRSVEDLIGMSGIVPLGTSLGEELDRFIKDHLTVQRPPFADMETSMKVLANGKADFVLVPRTIGNMLVSKLKVADRVAILDWSASRTDVHFLFSRKSPCLDQFAEFDKLLEEHLADNNTVPEILGGYVTP